MSLPTDLAREVADRVEQPGFDVVLDRAREGRRRRRRTALVSGLAAVCVVGGLAWGTGRGSDPGPDPAGPTRSQAPTEITGSVDPDLPADVHELLSEERTDPWVVSGSGGALAAIWAGCDDAGACHSALVSRLGERLSARILPDATQPRLQPVPGGWLVETDEGFTRVTPEGEDLPVLDPGGNAYDVQAGDTAVETSRGWLLLRGDKLVPVPVPDGEPVRAAYVTPAGRLVVAVERGSGLIVAATDEGVEWDFTHMTRTTERVAGAVLAGHGDHVAVALLGDDPDGSIPVVQVGVSGDAGATWETASGRELPFGGPGDLADLSGLAVSDEGTAWLTTGTAGLVRVDADANVVATRLSSHDRGVFLVVHRVCLVTERGRYDVLSCSDDDGTSWVTQALPGLQ
ncbi:hypothetical protein [Nocardioides sp.]|uniref:hypothetical protein n=1 Tax=Nocardioides sp. TaxID=35761 RepID=UPI0035B4191C